MSRMFIGRASRTLTALASRATKASTLGANSACGARPSRGWRARDRGGIAAWPQALERRRRDRRRRWPSGAAIRPLTPSRTSSRLAGRSDSSGMQPCAIASSTETETESLRRQAQVPARAGVPARPAWRRRGGRRTRRGRRPELPRSLRSQRVRAASRRWRRPGAPPGHARRDRREQRAARAAGRRSARGRGWRRTGRSSLAAARGGIASRPNGKVITSRAPSSRMRSRHVLRSRWCRSRRRAARARQPAQ